MTISYSNHSRKQGARACLPVSNIALLYSGSICIVDPIFYILFRSNVSDEFFTALFPGHTMKEAEPFRPSSVEKDNIVYVGYWFSWKSSYSPHA